jgi:catechol 2,3-dioxygenase-like lactoylglutathione lyase family enzyme
MDRPHMRVSSVVLGAADPKALAGFYHRLLGWEITEQYPARPGLPPQDGWAMLRPPPGEPGLQGLAIQWEPDYLPPAWPPVSGKQQMMLHLDIAVEDLLAGVAWALRAGATLADHQPQEHVRVLLDPAGHPFCLFRHSGQR